MSKFNNGKPYEGSPAVKNGGLRGATDYTDHFYFFCPKCPGQRVLRVLDYGVHLQEEENRYNTEFAVKAKQGFTLVFKLLCEQCGHKDFVKVTNVGWQGGDYQDALRGFRT
jgi:hypothetical protein